MPNILVLLATDHVHLMAEDNAVDGRRTGNVLLLALRLPQSSLEIPIVWELKPIYLHSFLALPHLKRPISQELKRPISQAKKPKIQAVKRTSSEELWPLK